LVFLPPESYLSLWPWWIVVVARLMSREQHSVPQKAMTKYFCKVYSYKSQVTDVVTKTLNNIIPKRSYNNCFGQSSLL
jgi:hypothetical protein